MMDRQRLQVAEPVAWVRFCSDGRIDGPILHAAMDEVRKRSGAWTPLYTARPAQSMPDMPLSMEQFAGLVGLAREDAREKAVAYKAINIYGETCYFGVESTARAWAKSGAVEEVLLRDLRVVAAPAPDEREQHAALTDADREQDSAKGWVAALRKAIDEYHAATVARCNIFGNSAHYECQRREHAAAETLIAMLAAAPAPADHFRDATKKIDSDAADERAAFEAWLGIKPCGAAHDFGWAAWQACAEKAASNEADAARYRFVKDYDNPDNPIAICRFEESGWDGQWVIEHDPDAVIDAAMAREAGNG